MSGPASPSLAPHTERTQVLASGTRLPRVARRRPCQKESGREARRQGRGGARERKSGAGDWEAETRFEKRGSQVGVCKVMDSISYVCVCEDQQLIKGHKLLLLQLI